MKDKGTKKKKEITKEDKLLKLKDITQNDTMSVILSL
jgi:hypothetical protein